MFARVNSVQTATDKLAGLLKWVEERLPAAREAPGFKGFYLLADPETGKVVFISLWETREQMPAGVRDEGLPVSWVTPPHLETYEVMAHI